MSSHSRYLSQFVKFFPSMVSGFLLTCAFPNIGWSYIIFIALVPWLVSQHEFTPKDRFFSGFVLGLVHFSTLIYWIIPTVHIYGQLPLLLAVAVLALLCLYLSLFPAVFGFIAGKTFKTNLFSPLWAACLWTGLELIRTHAFTGFSWGALGYSQYSNLNLIQVADFSGVLGVSFFIVFVNYSLYLAYCVIQKRLDRTRLFPLATSVILSLTVLFYGQHRIRHVSQEINQAPKARIALIQGNIDQDKKWSDAFKKSTVEKYTRLSKSVFPDKPDLMIWPETALPFYYGFDQQLSNRVDQTVRDCGTNFLIGSPAFERIDNAVLYFNRAYMLNRFSLVTGVYDKTHLVPFGEYVPLGQYLTFLGKITAQAGNFSKGKSLFAPLAFKNHKTGVLICFEILFPSISSRFVQNGADMLTTLTNDAWFGVTSAAKQHFSITVFRAVENRRSVARAANTGISGFVDPLGRILSQTPLFKDATDIRDIPMMKTMTFYTRHPDLFAVCCLIAFCLVFMIKELKQSFRRTT